MTSKVIKNIKKMMILGAAVFAVASPCSAHEVDGYNVAYTLTMEATAYQPTDGGGDGITATGIPAQWGIVAVDPDIIPLGTRLYIPGYGEALAADTGGAIEGHKIDLCMENYDDCMQFGRRDIVVHVLA